MGLIRGGNNSVLSRLVSGMSQLLGLYPQRTLSLWPVQACLQSFCARETLFEMWLPWYCFLTVTRHDSLPVGRRTFQMRWTCAMQTRKSSFDPSSRRKECTTRYSVFCRYICILKVNKETLGFTLDAFI
jgi:hypothetical protein